MIRVSQLVSVTFAIVLAVALIVTGPGLIHAQAKCPWLNAATAAGVLGGEVELSVSSTPEMPAASSEYPAADQRADRFDVTCDFHRKAGQQIYQLNIEVHTLENPTIDYAEYLARCNSNVPLTAIGNEAVLCRADTGAARVTSATDEVIGRVRNRIFVLTLNRPTQAAVESNVNELHEDTRNIAEQVAGSLF
jgi:hypothetical protein